MNAHFSMSESISISAVVSAVTIPVKTVFLHEMLKIRNVESAQDLCRCETPTRKIHYFKILLLSTTYLKHFEFDVWDDLIWANQ